MSAPINDLRANLSTKVAELGRDDLASSEDLEAWVNDLPLAKVDNVLVVMLARDAARRKDAPVPAGQAAEWIREHYPVAAEEWGQWL